MKRNSDVEAKLREALHRLASGASLDDQNRKSGNRVSVAAVAREANVATVTVFRYPSICDEIRAKKAGGPNARRYEARKENATETIKELKRQVNCLIDRNLELTVRLAKYEDPNSNSKVTKIADRARSRNT